MAMACIKRGIYVILEKLPVPLLSQFESLIAADVDRRVRVGFQMIGSQCIRSLKEILADHLLGELMEIRAGACWPRLDDYYSRADWAGRMTVAGRAVFDGPATNALAHLVHNVMFLGGDGFSDFAMPVEVEAELYRARPIESYDTACLRGLFSSGARFSVAVTHATKSALPFRIEIRGTKGWARISNDGSTLNTSCGVSCERSESLNQLIDDYYKNLIEIIHGQDSYFPSPLSDTRSYVATTNAMLRSAGGICNIDNGSVEQFYEDAKTGYHVANLREAVEETLLSGKLFSEQSHSWATAMSKPVFLNGFRGISMHDLESAICV